MAPATGLRLLQNHDNREPVIPHTSAMKKKFILTVFVLLTAAGFASTATNDLPTLLQRGLFEEEANHQLDAAIGDYKEAIGHFDHERQLAATAIFRLGECYRKQGRTNEANAQYERIMREFPDQAPLAQLSQANLPPGAGTTAAATAGASALPLDEEKFLRQVKESMQNSPDLVNEQFNQAVQNGYVSAAEFLLAHGADIKLHSTVIEAAQQGNEAMLRLLLSHGADVNNHNWDKDGHTALWFAVQKGFMAVCATLIANGADINLRSPIVTAAQQGNEAVVELLLSHGAAVDSPDGAGRTALSWAVQNGFMTVCQTLLAHGADVNAKDNNGSTSLHVAVREGKLSVAEFVVTNKAQIDAKTSQGETPLLSALARNDTNMVKLLLDNHADANMETSKGSTALTIAVDDGMTDVVRMLADHGADVNALDRNGRPPLAHLNNPDSKTGRQIKELLIKAGADANYNRRRAIWTCDLGGTPKMEVFQCPTNSINHYTLLNYLATLYKANPERASVFVAPASYAHPDDLVPFPDFARVAIHRLDGKRSEVLRVNVTDILQSGDGSKDVALQPGDMVEIPEQEHKVADHWFALSQADVTALNKCLVRTVRLAAKGQTNRIALAPSLGVANQTSYTPYHGTLTPDLETNWLTESLHGPKPDAVVRSFELNTVVRSSNVLLNTWDLSRVRLTRGGVKLTFDLTTQPAPDVWLEEGDVMEIPELGEGAPARSK
jgi:ankyrin repeat protein